MQALDNIMILDLGRRYPASYSTMFLADFGAEVIEIFPPGTDHADATQQQHEIERVTAFRALDRNKQSMVIDFKNHEGIEVFYRLVKKADVLIEGFRPGVMERLKLGYPILKALNRRLIYCSLSGFGQTGPYSQLPAHDINFIGFAGALSMVGPQGGKPCQPSNFIADMGGAGLHGTIGILIALLARERTGEGQFVDISYVDGAASLLINEITSYFTLGTVPVRGETDVTGGAVWSQIFECKDGKYFTIGNAEPHLWENLCRALSREDLITLHDVKGPKKDYVLTELSKIFLRRNRDDWFDYLKEKNTCIGPVNTVEEALSDPQMVHRNMVINKIHPKFGDIRQIGFPIKLSATPAHLRSLGKIAGMDTNNILSSIGYDNEQIRALRKNGAVG